MTIQLTDKQLDLISNAVEYLGRHLLGQKAFKPVIMADWIDEDRKKEHMNVLLDMRKSIKNYQWDPQETRSVHQYDVMQMWKEPLITIS